MTVSSRGTLESQENRDVVCRVKATKGGTSATTIKWVIDDGTVVRAGRPIVVLDSSALEDQYLTQRIVMETARAASITADGNYTITALQNESDEQVAKNAIQLAELDLEKYVGLPKGTLNSLEAAEAKMLLADMDRDIQSFLTKSVSRFPKAKGEYQQLIDDVTGRIELARSDVEQWKDRMAYSQRMQLKGYVSAAQVVADESRLSAASEAFKKVETERNLLTTFAAQRTVKSLSGLALEAWRAFDRVKKQSIAKEAQALADRETKRSVYLQEEDKLEEIEKQIHACKIHAPEDGMVVYYLSEQTRSGGGSQNSIIAQGEPVREGQKLMRIPDLNKMQVTLKVHESMVSRIKGDDRRATGFSDVVRACLLLNTDGVGRLLSQQQDALYIIRQEFQDQEYVLVSEGQKAEIRIDSYPGRVFKGPRQERGDRGLATGLVHAGREAVFDRGDHRREVRRLQAGHERRGEDRSRRHGRGRDRHSDSIAGRRGPNRARRGRSSS